MNYYLVQVAHLHLNLGDPEWSSTELLANSTPEKIKERIRRWALEVNKDTRVLEILANPALQVMHGLQQDLMKNYTKGAWFRVALFQLPAGEFLFGTHMLVDKLRGMQASSIESFWV